MTTKQIEIAVLREACDRIFKFISDDLKIKTVNLEENFYWTLSDDVRYKMQITPVTENVGSLFDDYDFVVPVATDSDQALPLMFEHIAPLLSALATKLPNFK